MVYVFGYALVYKCVGNVQTNSVCIIDYEVYIGEPEFSSRHISPFLEIH